MSASPRLLTSIEPEKHDRFTRLAQSRGVSSSRLLALLIDSVLTKVEVPAVGVGSDAVPVTPIRPAPAEKYTIRLTGEDATRLESRAAGRSMTASGYVAHLLRAHLRANPPMPHDEFEALKRVVNELGAIRASLAVLTGPDVRTRRVDAQMSGAVERLLPVLATVRADVQAVLTAHSKSWEVQDA